MDFIIDEISTIVQTEAKIGPANVSHMLTQDQHVLLESKLLVV